jgi:YrhK-like protein
MSQTIEQAQEQAQEQAPEQAQEKEFTIRLGQRELRIRRQYETASIINDFLIALWFTLGSIFILFHELETEGIWLFIIGSAQLLIRPTIRLAHRVHLRSITESTWEC